MHNESYFPIMQLGRWDLLLRSGSFGDAMKNGWAPVVAAQSVKYRRPVARFAKYTLRSRSVYWDDRDLHVEHTFERDGEMLARAVVRCRVRSRDRTVLLSQIALRLGHGQSPARPTWLDSWELCERNALAAPPRTDAALQIRD